MPRGSTGSGREPLTPDTYVPWPLDIRCLELLPDEGLIGGVHHAGRRVVALVDDINDEAGQKLVSSGQVQGRLRTMKLVGLVKNFPATGGSVWARTVAGKRFLVKQQLASAPDEEVGQQADSKSEPGGVTIHLDERRTASG